jgi:hypothetical protein
MNTTPEEHVEYLFKLHTKTSAKTLVESQIENLDTKMDKFGYTTEDLSKMKFLKSVRELIIKHN